MYKIECFLIDSELKVESGILKQKIYAISIDINQLWESILHTSSGEL